MVANIANIACVMFRVVAEARVLEPNEAYHDRGDIEATLACANAKLGWGNALWASLGRSEADDMWELNAGSLEAPTFYYSINGVSGSKAQQQQTKMSSIA